MIQAVYYKDRDRVMVEGHAQSGEIGRDLVCAACSILTCTLGENVRQMERTGVVNAATVEIGPGKAEISWKPSRKYAAIVQVALEAVCAGFEILAAMSPEYISYEIHGGQV